MPLRKLSPLPRPDPLEPPGRLAAAAVADADRAVDRGGRLSGLAPAGGVHAGHHPHAQRRLLRQRRGRPRVRPARQAHRAAPGDQRRGVGAGGAGAGRGAGAAGLRAGAHHQRGHHRLVVRGAGRSRWSTRTPSALCPCRRRCWAWRSASASRWRLPPCRSRVPPLAWVLLLGNLFWVLAYDTEYAMVDRDDDLRIGMKTSAITLGALRRGGGDALLPGVPGDLGCRAAGRGAIRYLLHSDLAWRWRRWLWHFRLIRDRSREGCFKAFRLNHWLGFTVFAGVAVCRRRCCRIALAYDRTCARASAHRRRLGAELVAQFVRALPGGVQGAHELRLHAAVAPWT